MSVLLFSLGVVVGFLAFGFVMKLPHEDVIDFHFKAYRVYEYSYAKWMYYIANGLNNASDKNINYLLQDLGAVTRLLADLVGEKDATLRHYVGDVYLDMERRNNDEH